MLLPIRRHVAMLLAVLAVLTLEAQAQTSRPGLLPLSTSSTAAAKHFRTGLIDAIDTRYGRAAVQAERALAADSSFAAARALYAWVKPRAPRQWRAEQIERALRELANGSTEEMLFAVAVRDHTRGQLPRALVTWRALVELVPDDPLLHTAVPLYLGWSGDRDAALAAAEALTERFPDHASGYAQLGAWRLAARGDQEAALAAYQEYVRLAPESPNAHRVLAHHLSTELGRHSEAVAHYRRTVELDSTYTYGWFGLAGEALRSGQPDSAEIYMGLLLKHEPLEEERARFATYRANLRAFRGNPAGAVNDLVALARQYATLGLAAEVPKLLTTAAAIDAALASGSRTDSLLAAARAAPAPGPANPGVLMLEGIAEALVGRVQQARGVAAALDSIAAQPGRAGASEDAGLVRGMALLAEGRSVEARAELSGLEGRYNPIVRAAMARARSAAGDAAEAAALRDAVLRDTQAEAFSPLAVIARALIERVQ